MGCVGDTFAALGSNMYKALGIFRGSRHQTSVSRRLLSCSLAKRVAPQGPLVTSTADGQKNFLEIRFEIFWSDRKFGQPGSVVGRSSWRKRGAQNFASKPSRSARSCFAEPVEPRIKSFGPVDSSFPIVPEFHASCFGLGNACFVPFITRRIVLDLGLLALFIIRTRHYTGGKKPKLPNPLGGSSPAIFGTALESKTQEFCIFKCDRQTVSFRLKMIFNGFYLQSFCLFLAW